MKKAVLLLVATLLISSVTAFELPRIGETERQAFTNMLRNYFLPTIHGWGIGYDCTSDAYLTAKFFVVNVKTLPYDQIVSILREAKASNTTDWFQIRERVRAAIEANGTIITKGRISINGTKYLLTNIVKTEASLTADIRSIPDFASCKQQGISYEQCELQGAKVGSISLAKATQTELPGEPKVWAGTLEFNGKTYKFVALTYPRSGA